MYTSNSEYEIGQGSEYKGEEWWRWWAFIEASTEALNKIEKVIYTLHPTFSKPVQISANRDSQFRITEEGWGTFLLYASLQLKDGSTINLEQELELEFPDGSMAPA